MSEKKHGLAKPSRDAPDEQRRRLTTAGLVGAGVIMTVPSRSALGAGFGQCGSESVSAALSRYGELADCGCSPGFWWRSPQGTEKWADPEIISPQFGPYRGFNEVFGVDLLVEDKPLVELGPNGHRLRANQINLDCGNGNGNGSKDIHAVIYYAIAALLNASFYGSRYPSIYNHPDDVIAAFRAALLSPDPCAELEVFKAAVDVYDGIWCFNGVSQGDRWSD